jgi:oligopeptide transport system permease protein
MNKNNIKIVEDYANIKGRSLWVDARRRLFQNKAAVVSLILLFFCSFFIFFWSFFPKI